MTVHPLRAENRLSWQVLARGYKAFYATPTTDAERLYARFKRMVGRQRLSRVRPWLTVCLFPLLVVVLLLGSIAQPVAGLALLAGLAAGAALGVCGLGLTQFERTPVGLGSPLTLLIFGTLAGYYVTYAAGLLRSGPTIRPPASACTPRREHSMVMSGATTRCASCAARTAAASCTGNPWGRSRGSKMGVNARNFEAGTLDGVVVVEFDGASAQVPA